MENQKNSATTVEGKPESETESNRIIYSLGSSIREKDEFVQLLKEFGIETLVDVRGFPKSNFDYFCKDKLSLVLKRHAIEYHYLGEGLGGFRDKGYQQYTKTKDFFSGFEELKDAALKRRTVFMCAERFPWRCHRRFIAQVLEKEGWRVIHIIDEGKIWETKPKNLRQKKKKKNKSLRLPI